MQYTFTDGDLLVFMNMETFEEQRIDKAKIENVLLMKEGLSCTVTLWNDNVIDVQLPPNVSYKGTITPNYLSLYCQSLSPP